MNLVFNSGELLWLWRTGKLMDGCSCGICRQVISEFSTAETRVIYQFNNKIVIKPFKDLLPDAFTKDSLEITK
jgi:cytidine deaminase